MRSLTGAALLFLVACTASQSFPGDQALGDFEFTAQVVDNQNGDLPSCLLAQFSDGGAVFPEFGDGDLSFAATLSRVQDGGQDFLTIGGVSRDADFDGQVIRSSYEVVRRFQTCNCETSKIRETLDVALLSVSQVSAAGECPSNALDGGVPVDPDAGIFPPSTTDAGFDAARACGELTDELVPGDDCECEPCEVRYQVRGLRR